MIFLEVHLGPEFFLLVLLMLFGIPVLFTVIGFLIRRRNKKVASVFFILAVVYLLVSLGTCLSLT